MFNDDGSLTSSEGLTWTEESDGLSLSNEGLNKIELIASVNNDANLTGDIIIEDIVVKVGNTYTGAASEAELVGLSVKIASDPLICN